MKHRFLDEAGDTTFYGKGKTIIIGQPGVSHSFMIGMLTINEALEPIRQKIIELQKSIVSDPYYNKIRSINKKISGKGYFFHATDDIPEVRKQFYEFIKSIDCNFEAVVARKVPDIYVKKHNNNEAEFYADILSHIIKNKLHIKEKLVLNIAHRGRSTKNNNLKLALTKAQKHSLEKYSKTNAEIVFNIQNHYSEPILNIADYLCWAIQSVFERGEDRYYDFIKAKISLVIDLYDKEKYKDKGNYYQKGNELTVENKISRLIH